MKLTWTKLGERELWDAFLWISERNPDAASDWFSHVAFMTRILEDHPRIGHLLRREGGNEFRETIVGRYRFVYRCSKSILQIRRVRHVRRDYNPMTIRDGARTITLLSAPPP